MKQTDKAVLLREAVYLQRRKGNKMIVLLHLMNVLMAANDMLKRLRLVERLDAI